MVSRHTCWSQACRPTTESGAGGEMGFLIELLLSDLDQWTTVWSPIWSSGNDRDYRCSQKTLFTVRGVVDTSSDSRTDASSVLDLLPHALLSRADPYNSILNVKGVSLQMPSSFIDSC